MRSLPGNLTCCTALIVLGYKSNKILTPWSYDNVALSYFLYFLKMVILELRYSGTEPSIYKKAFFLIKMAYAYPYPGRPTKLRSCSRSHGLVSVTWHTGPAYTWSRSRTRTRTHDNRWTRTHGLVVPVPVLLCPVHPSWPMVLYPYPYLPIPTVLPVPGLCPVLPIPMVLYPYL